VYKKLNIRESYWSTLYFCCSEADDNNKPDGFSRMCAAYGFRSVTQTTRDNCVRRPYAAACLPRQPKLTAHRMS